MNDQELNRRDFHRLTMAAFGGVVAGTVAGCGGDEKPAASTAKPAAGTAADSKAKPEGTQVAVVTGEPHACRGLNSCKNQGASGKNDCAGQGDCATKSWEHSCSGENGCKGQGGCGADPTQNECKGKGGCHIPLMDGAWEKARKHFEETMKDKGKDVGTAPAKAKK